jgi:hypothetical protein
MEKTLLMRHCKKNRAHCFLFLFACAAGAFSAPLSDAKHPIISDTTLLAEDLADTIVAKKPATASLTTSESQVKATGTDIKVLTSPVQATDSSQIHTNAMFKTLASYHRTMGIYNIAAGVLAILAGAAILNKEDILPFSLSLITLGGITVGIGVWDVSIGNKLSNSK